MFTIFSFLPVEVRLKIWAFASNQNPRTLDIWTDFKHCHEDNTIFYTQTYFSELSNLSPQAVLQTSRESREEALKHYALEFRTEMLSIILPARFYINYATDILIPRGHWNLISFADFASRAYGRLRHLAIDVSGSFWTENLKKRVVEKSWIFDSVKELLLYDSSNEKMWKGMENLDRFRERDKDGPSDMRFEKLEEPGQKIKDAKQLIEESFDRILGLRELEIMEVSARRRLDAFEPNVVDFIKPSIKTVKLLASVPYSV